MTYSELFPAEVAALAAAVFVHLRQVRSRTDASLRDHLGRVLVDAAVVFLVVILIQHPEWLTPFELG